MKFNFRKYGLDVEYKRFNLEFGWFSGEANKVFETVIFHLDELVFMPFCICVLGVSFSVWFKRGRK